MGGEETMHLIVGELPGMLCRYSCMQKLGCKQVSSPILLANWVKESVGSTSEFLLPNCGSSDR